MKQTSYLATTLVQARQLQGRYRKLGAKGTQNVRNPKPLRELVMEAVPVIRPPKGIKKGPGEFGLDDFTTQFSRRVFHVPVKLTVAGRRIVKEMEIDVHEVFPDIPSLGASVDEIVAKLEALGYMVLRQSVQQTLSNLRSADKIGAVPAPSNPKYPGYRPPLKYFAVQES